MPKYSPFDTAPSQVISIFEITSQAPCFLRPTTKLFLKITNTNFVGLSIVKLRYSSEYTMRAN